MIQTLRSYCHLLPRLVLLLLMIGAGRPAFATHLLGGEMTYRYLGATGPAAAPLRYEITVTIYNNCNNAAIRPSAAVGIYDQATGNRVVLTTTNYAYTTTVLSGQSGMMSIPQTSITGCIAPVVPPGCTITGVSQPYQLQKYVAVVNLPVSAKGYYALFTDGTRNVDITNLYDPSGQSLTLYATLAPALIPNRSPVFSDVAVAIVCAHDTTVLLNNAVDADGDRLVYTFGQPYGTTGGNGVLPTAGFTPPPPLVPYVAGAGYSATTPFGTAAGNFAKLDPMTGVASYGAATVGRKYAVAVDVQEYRTINGQEILIGTTRRDLQLVVASCPPTKAPLLPPPAITPRSYTIEAGSTLSIPITATQADGHPLAMTLNSVLLDGPGGYAATLDGNAGTVAPGYPTGTATTTGVGGSVTGKFVFVAGCADARATPYDVALTVKDNGCAGKTVADVLHITVTKPSGPTAISGDPLVCGLGSVHTYAASGGTAPKVSWRVVGGTIVGSRTANPVQVQWPAAGSGTLVARGLTQYGCLTDSVQQAVTVAPAAALAVGGRLTICLGGSTTLAVAGGTAPYTVVGGATPVTGAGPFVLSPTQTTTYTITGTAMGNMCGATAQATVVVLPLPAANAGPARSACSGLASSLGGAAVAGSTYSWSPTTGLSSPTAANPTVLLTNSTSTPLTQTYTLTETNAAGCQASNSVTVTIAPAVVAVPGSAVAVCAGSSAQLGAAPVAGLTYNWSPTTGLSSPTAANPTVLLTNSTSAPLTQTYTLTATTAAGCVGTGTVAVTVNPVVLTAVALPTQPAQCAGTALTFSPLPTNAGAAPTYRWFVNNAPVATSPTYTSTTLADGDQVRVELTPTAGFCSSGVAVATTTVSLIPAPRPTLVVSSPTALPACPGVPVAFQFDKVTDPGANPQYQWQLDGTAVAGATGPTFTSTQLRDGQAVTLALRTTTACGPVTVVSNAVRVAINQAVDVEAGPDKSIMEGDDVVLEGTANGSYPVVWTPTLGLDFAGHSRLQPLASPVVTTTYTLSAGVGDCADRSLVTVTVTPRVRIPNAISPNGDGHDDTWQIDHIGDYSNNHVLVFNRWGSKIFEASGYGRSHEWDGTIGGQPAPVGTYYYVITLGTGKTYSGPLTVVY